MCDASAAVPLDSSRFIVADDEDNLLRGYDVRTPGAPLWSFDVSPALGVAAKPPKPGKRPKAPPELDIEAATRVGDVAFWMTSHGRNSSGKLKPERLKLFATQLSSGSAPLRVVGRAYGRLLEDLLAEPRLAGFGLREAAQLAPKEPGGLNIEGMATRREGGVWIGFRNPIPAGKALLVPLLNPERMMHGDGAQLGEPRQLDLEGLGVRALTEHAGRYLVLAGPFDSQPGSALFMWDGVAGAERLPLSALDGLNPEGFFNPKGSERILVLSDDGAVAVDGTECKRLKDPAQKRFRARWIKP